MSLHRDTYAEINLKYLKENIETTYKKFKRPLMAGKRMLMVMDIEKWPHILKILNILRCLQ